MSIDTQLYLEMEYGAHTDTQLLKDEINNNEVILNKIIGGIEKYKSLSNNYWDSKKLRVSHVDIHREAMSLLIAILRSNTVRSIQEIAIYIAKRIGYNFIEDIKTAADIIGSCQGELYSIIKQNGEWYVQPNIQVDQELRDIITSRQYMLPMVCQPQEWTNNHDGGWLTKKESVIHGNNPDDHKQALDVLNILQNQEWVLDPYVLTLEEVPNKSLDTVDKIHQFNELKKVSQDAYSVIGNQPFHFVWRYDKRGRMYSQGYQINLQSTKYKKALISLKEPVLLEGALCLKNQQLSG